MTSGSQTAGGTAPGGGDPPKNPADQTKAGFKVLGDSAKGLSDGFTKLGGAISSSFTQPLEQAYGSAVKMAEQLNILNGNVAGQSEKMREARTQAIKLAESLGIYDQAAGRIRPQYQRQIEGALAVSSAWERFRNQLTLVGIQILSALGPTLITLIHNMQPLIGLLQSAATWFGGLSSTSQRLIVGFGVAVVVMGALFAAIGTALGVLVPFIAAIAAGGEVVIAIIAGLVGFAAQVAIAVAVWVTWGDKIVAGARKIVDGTKVALDWLEDFFTHRIPAAVSTMWGAVTSGFSAMVRGVTEFAAWLRDAIPRAIDAVVAAAQRLGQQLAAWGAAAVQTVSTWASQVAAAVAAGWNWLKQATTELAAYLAGALSNAFQALLAAAQALGQRLAAWASGAVDAVVSAFSRLWQLFSTDLPGLLAALPAWLMQVIPAMLDSLVQALSGFAAEVTAWATTVVNGAIGIFGVLWKFLGTDLPALLTAVPAWIMQTVGGILNAVLGGLQSFAQQMVGLVDRAVGGALGFFGSLWTFLSEDLPSLLGTFLGKLASWATQVGAWASHAADVFIYALKGLPHYIVHELIPDLLDMGKDLWQSFIHGLFQAMRRGTGIADELVKWFERYLGPDVTPSVGGGHKAPARDGAPTTPATPGVSGTVQTSNGTNIYNTLHRSTVNNNYSPIQMTAPAGTPAAGMQMPKFQQPKVTGPAGTPKKVTPKGTPGENHTGSGTANGAAQEKKPSQLAQALGMVKEKFNGIVASLSPLGVFGTFLEGVMQGLTPVIDALKEPLKMVGQILGAALAPVLKAMFPIFKFTAIAATYLGQIIFTVAGGIAKFIGALIHGIGHLIAKIPGLHGLGHKVESAGDAISNIGKGLLDGANELKKGRKELEDMQFGDTAEKVKDVNEALTNVPSGYKIALARLKAAEPVAAPAPVTAAGYGTGGAASGGGSDNSVTVNGNIVIQGADKDGRTLWEEIKQQMRRENLRQSGTTAGVAFA